MRRILRDKLGKDVDTDIYEDIIAQEVIDPATLDVSMEDIGGLEDAKRVLVSLLPRSLLTATPHLPHVRACRVMALYTNWQASFGGFLYGQQSNSATAWKVLELS